MGTTVVRPPQFLYNQRNHVGRKKDIGAGTAGFGCLRKEMPWGKVRGQQEASDWDKTENTWADKVLEG